MKGRRNNYLEGERRRRKEKEAARTEDQHPRRKKKKHEWREGGKIGRKRKGMNE